MPGKSKGCNPLKKCYHCEECGCPKCLGTGFTINKIIKEYNHCFKDHLGFAITIEDFYSLSVVQQRSVFEYINGYIKLHNLSKNG